MKFFKMLGSAAFVAVLMMIVGACDASATTLTSPAGTEYGGMVKLELQSGTSATFQNNFIGQIKCEASEFEGKVESQGASATAQVKLSTFDFYSCNGTFMALKPGLFEVHTDSASADGNGIVTSNGAELTTELTGLHCIFSTSNTSFGTVTGGTSAALTIESAVIPRTGGRSGSFCGSSMTLTARYRFVTPKTLLVD